MGFPACHSPNFVLARHILQEGDDAANFFNQSGLKSGRVIVLNKSTQALVDHVPDFHRFFYHLSPYCVKLRYTKIP